MTEIVKFTILNVNKIKSDQRMKNKIMTYGLCFSPYIHQSRFAADTIII